MNIIHISGLAVRGSNLQARIDKLAVKVTQLDSNVEEVTLQEIQLRKAFRSTQNFDQQVVSRETMPKSMMEQYLACDKPPPLDKLNPYREVLIILNKSSMATCDLFLGWKRWSEVLHRCKLLLRAVAQ